MIKEEKRPIFHWQWDYNKTHKSFKWLLRIGLLRFYVTYRYRMRNPQTRDSIPLAERQFAQIKKDLYVSCVGKCEMCGKKMRLGDIQMHHVLPFKQFPQYEYNKSNIMMLCNECHHGIHRNPFLDCKLQEEKAKELNINLKEYYDV